jgi:hypothetical protein
VASSLDDEVVQPQHHLRRDESSVFGYGDLVVGVIELLQD